MNPYSFKRFLQDTDRRSHPIQVVSSEANSILVQGDLPDCVQNQSASTMLPARLDLSFMGLEHSDSDLNNAAEFQDFPQSDSMGIPNSNFTGPVSFAGYYPTTAQILPDVYPHRVVDEFHRHMTTNVPERLVDTAPCGLPDFISDQPLLTHTHSSTDQTLQHIRPASACLLPERKTSFSIGSLRPRSFECLSDVKCDPEYQGTPTRDVTVLDKSVNLTLSPNISGSLPHHNNNTGGAINEAISGPSVITDQQRQIDMLLLRQTELQHRLQQMQTLLNDKEMLLASIRAECEVVERQAELRIKSLEHELAEEKYRSAQDRWAVQQLRNQLAQMSTDETTGSRHHHMVWNEVFPLDTSLSRFQHAFRSDPFDMTVSTSQAVWSSANVDNALGGLFAQPLSNCLASSEIPSGINHDLEQRD